jgi:hypothetical protein
MSQSSGHWNVRFVFGISVLAPLRVMVIKRVPPIVVIYTLLFFCGAACLTNSSHIHTRSPDTEQGFCNT